MSAEKVTYLRRKKGLILAKLTKYDRFTDKLFESNEKSDKMLVELVARQENLPVLYKEHEVLVSALTEITTEAEFVDLQADIDLFEDKFYELVSKMQEVSVACQLTSKLEVKNIQLGKPEASKLGIKLPEFKINKFNGEQLKWLAFKNIFTTIIHNRDDISDVVKFTFLLDSLTGKASDAIGTINLSAEGYESAWRNLMKVYDKPKAISQANIIGLFNLPKCSKDSPQELRTLINQLTSHIVSLNAMDFKTDRMSELLIINIIINCVHSSLETEFNKTLTVDEIPRLENLITFLEKECSNLEIRIHEPTRTIVPTQFIKQKPFHRIQPTRTMVATSNFNKFSNSTFPCNVCKQSGHSTYQCELLLKLPIKERIKKVSHLCANCFSPQHTTSNCKSQHGCKVCGSRHNTVLHQHVTNDITSNNNYNTTQPTTSAHCATEIIPKQVLLSTAVVLLKSANHKYIECRALLDSGSQSNFISSNLAKKLGIHCQSVNIPVSGINNTKSEITEKIVTILKSRVTNYNKSLEFLVIPAITNNLPAQFVDISLWNIPKQYKLADPGFNYPSPIDLLIGAELFFTILQSQEIIIQEHLPRLHKTQFGWIVAGKIHMTSQLTQSFASFSCSEESDDECINAKLQRFWELESIPNQTFLTSEEQQAEEHFTKTHRRENNGRYIVRLPMKQSTNNLGESRPQAEKRFHYLERKLDKDPSLKLEYQKFMNEYLDLGHMVEVDENKDPVSQKSYYLPHHAVIKLSSSTTKTRVVFDASANSTSNLSLNDILLVGPTIQNDLFSIMIRSRKYQLLFTADIPKMYRQINVDRRDTHLQRILWRNKSHEPIKTFELTTVTYGTASAPFLATRSLKQLALDEGYKFPIAAEIILNDFYVDDVITGADTLQELNEKRKQLNDILALGGFQLHKWSSNSRNFLNSIPINQREELKCHGLSQTEAIKTLGLYWQPLTDKLLLNISTLNDNPSFTKKAVLSDISKLFDPLGLVAPVVINGKIFMQSLWQHKIEWKDEISDELKEQWLMLRIDLPALNDISFNRCCLVQNPTKVQLLGFADASEKAFGCCVYIRSKNNDNEVSIHLLTSKSRVAPIQTESIPRLELCAALLLSQLIEKVVTAMNISFDDIILWSDSTITLSWMLIEPQKLKTFIANRVSKIQLIQTKLNIVWKHVCSEDNPADIVSRGICTKEYSTCKKWWHGPSFLLKHENMWPEMTIIKNAITLPELKSEATTVMTLSTDRAEEFSVITKFSNYQRMINVTAFILRFIRNCRSNDKLKRSQSLVCQESLTTDELSNAKLKLVKLVQETSFKLDIKILQRNGELPHNSRIKSLHPFIDSNGIIRVGGRLANATINYDTKHQMLLPYDHHFTRTLFIHTHIQQFHAGPQLLLSTIRNQFWPIKGKHIAHNTYRNCILCSKFRPSTLHQLMGNLPANRVTPDRPFSTTGVDLSGPYNIKQKYQRKDTQMKAYIANFVCFVTKGTHLEIVLDLTAESFIQALKRFIARRLHPTSIYSDNATNFHGEHNIIMAQQSLLKDQDQDLITNFCASQNLQWKFIPARSPHFGGLWESSVKSFKSHFKKVINDTALTYEEMLTLINQIEAILNSRPITPMSSNPNDPLPLTPAHLMMGGPITALYEKSLINIPDNRLTNWQKLNKMVQSFWNRYHKEYLNTLQQRHKWKSPTDNLNLGDIVLIYEENTPTNKWPIGRIVTLYPGTDGIVRAAEVRTLKEDSNKTKDTVFQYKTFTGAITKLCKLPVNESTIICSNTSS